MRRKRDTSLAARLRRVIPWVDDPDPIREVVTSSEPGMSEDEVWRQFVIHTEHKQVQKEKHEDAQKNSQVNQHGQRRKP